MQLKCVPVRWKARPSIPPALCGNGCRRALAGSTTNRLSAQFFAGLGRERGLSSRPKYPARDF